MAQFARPCKWSDGDFARRGNLYVPRYADRRIVLGRSWRKYRRQFQAAVDFDAVAHGAVSPSDTSIADFTLTIGSISNGAVVVIFTWDVGAAPPTGITITVGGNTPTLIPGTVSNEADFVGTEMHGIATGSDTGAQTISVSWTNAVSATATALSFSGVDQSTPFQNGTQAGYGFSATSASLAITSATDNMTLDGLANRTSTGITAPNFTQRFNTTDGDQSAAGQTEPGSATNTHTWTMPTGRAGQSGVDIRAFVGAAEIPAARPAWNYRPHA